MRASRVALATGAVVVVVAIALIVGLQLRDRSTTVATPSASPTSSPSSAPSVSRVPAIVGSASPSATQVAASQIYNDNFGFIVVPGDVPVAYVRKESSSDTIRQIISSFATVSPDGRQLALFSLADGPELQVMDLGTGATRTLVKLARDQQPGGVVWSNDGGTLLYSTATGSFGVGGGTNSATLNVYELAATGLFHGTTIDSQANTGFLYRPIAFDRTRDIPLAVAGLTGEGGFMASYVTVKQQPSKTFDVERVDTKSKGFSMGSVRASSDAAFVLGVTTNGDISWWRLDNIGASKTLAGAGKRGALWRPGTHQIGYLAPDGHAAADPFWLQNVETNGSQQLCCVAFGAVPPTARIETFRADGSAVLLVVVPARPGPGTTYDYTLVRLPGEPQGGLEYPTSGDRVTFQVIGRIGASVRLR